MRISHEAIYQALYVQGRGALRRELTACLRTGRALRVPRARSRRRGKSFVTPEIMISERSAEAADRAVPGHWEGDLIIGLGRSAIGTLVERTTRFTMLLHLPRMEGHGTVPRVKNGPALAGHGAEAVRDAITRTITTLPAQLRRSLTWDQGAEMARHADLRIATGLPVYFCEPHSPWQRGTNENTNGLLRQYFPKGTDLSAHSPDSHQLHRTLGITVKSAWFMSHRVREAMRNDGSVDFGAGGGVVEVDETFIGHDKTIKPKHSKKGRGYAHKHKVLTLVDRSTGRAKSLVVDDLRAKTLVPILKENIAKEATIYTDEAGQYTHLDRYFEDHDFVRHGAGEYVRGDVHTNTIEGYFSIFKRGMKGVHQHCAKKHLHRYASEFEFRYNHRSALGVEDSLRAEHVLSSVKGKRLTYRGSSMAA